MSIKVTITGIQKDSNIGQALKQFAIQAKKEKAQNVPSENPLAKDFHSNSTTTERE